MPIDHPSLSYIALLKRKKVGSGSSDTGWIPLESIITDGRGCGEHTKRVALVSTGQPLCLTVSSDSKPSNWVAHSYLLETTMLGACWWQEQ